MTRYLQLPFSAQFLRDIQNKFWIPTDAKIDLNGIFSATIFQKISSTIFKQLFGCQFFVLCSLNLVFQPSLAQIKISKFSSSSGYTMPEIPSEWTFKGLGQALVHPCCSGQYFKISICYAKILSSCKRANRRRVIWN